jgi:outer membrane protein OmpA-like peptidoglycan-associated protein
MTAEKVALDSAMLMAVYKATVTEYKEPAKVHAREITAKNLTRAEELRDWAVNGRLPVLLQGRALLFPEAQPDIEAAFSAASANTDSLLGEYSLAGAPVLLPGKPMVAIGNKSVPDISQKTKLTGPYVKPAPYGFGFNDLSRQDRLYQPEMVVVAELSQLTGTPGGQVVATVHFDEAKADIRADDTATLNRTVRQAKESQARFAITGHADPRGDDASNYELGLRRAGAVREFLTGAGIDPGRIDVNSAGESQTISKSPDQYDQDRRVEITRLETAVPIQDSARLGTYATLDRPLPPDYVSSLFRLGEKAVSAPLKTPAGTLLVKVTKKDTAQKATFQDIAKRFSSSSSRWSGGDLYWLARDDKAHDKKLVDAAFSLSKGDISPVIKINDSSYVFLTMEEKKAALTRPFSEVRSKIDNKLRRAQEKQLYDQMLSDLRAKAKIEIVMKEADFVVEPLPDEAQPTEAQPAPAEPKK